MIPLHLDSLDINRQKVFKELKVFRPDGVLAGGTAIALQIGHRKSYDFDIFTDSALTPRLWNKVKKVFGKGVVRTMFTKKQLNFVTPDNISITFFHDEVKPLYPEIQSGYIDLADLRDLASNKAFTIGHRGKWRDYVDLYFLLKLEFITLDQIINDCSQRTKGETFPAKLFLEQLVYFEDLSVDDIYFIGSTIEPQEIKRFLSLCVNKYNHKQLG
jgi:hypothetical protein